MGAKVGPGWRRATTVTLAAALVATLTSVGVVLAPSASGAATTLEVLNLQGAPLSRVELHASGVDVVPVALIDQSANTGPTTLRLTVPRGFRVAGLSSVDATGGRPTGGHWSCSTRHATTSCSLHHAVSSSPTIIAYVELVNHRSVAQGPRTALSIRGSLDGAPASSLDVPVSIGPTNLPSVSLDRSMTPVVSGNAAGSVSYVVHDNAGAPVAAGAVAVDHAIPPSIRSWQSRSPGWRCAGAPTSSPTCTYEHGISVNAAASPLTLTYRVNGPALLRGHDRARDAWSSSLVVTGPYGVTLQRAVPGAVAVTSSVVGSLRVQVETIGSQSVSRGETSNIAIIHQASDGVASGLADTIIVPTGFTMLAKHVDGWSCPGGTGKLTCQHPAPILTNAPFVLRVALRASTDAPVGMAIVAVVSIARDASVKNAGLAIVNVLGHPAPTAPAAPATPVAAASPLPGSPTSRASSTSTPSPAKPTHPTTSAPVHAPPASLGPSTRSSHAVSTTTVPVATTATPHVTCPGASITLGPFALTSAAWTPNSTSCSGTATIDLGSGLSLFSGASIAVNVTYSDAADWTVTIAATQTGITFFGITPSFTGTVTAVNGTISGALSIDLSPVSAIALGGGVTLSGSITLSSSSGTTPTLSASADLTIGLVNSSVAIPVSLAYTNSSTWSVTAQSGTIAFDAPGTVANPSPTPVTIAVSGTVTDSSGALATTLTASTAAPVTIVPGVTFEGSLSLSLATGSSSATFTGTATLTVGTLSLPVSFTYTDPRSWSASLSMSNSSSSIAITPDFSIPLSNLSGTVAYGLTNGSDFPSVQWNVTASLSPVTLIAGVAQLSSLTLTIANTCPTARTLPCPAANNDTYIALGGNLALTFSPLSTQDLTFSAFYDLTTKAFDLAASMPGPITVVSNVLTISNPTFELAYNDPTFANPGSAVSLNGLGTASGFSLLVSGTVSLNFAGTALTTTVSLVYDTNGLAVVADFTPPFELGSTGASINTIAYVTTSATLSLNGVSVNVPANTFVLGGSLSLPSFIATFLGQTSSISIYVTYTSASDFSVNAVFPMSVPVSASSEFSFTFGDLALSAGMSNGTAFITLSEAGTLTISGDAAGSTPQSVAVTLALSYQPTTSTLVFSIAGSGVNGAPAWQNAFGYPGLDITNFGIQAGVTLVAPIPLPSFGLTASGSLPATITSDLGIGTGQDVPLSFTMNISATNPCLAVAIGNPAPNAPSVVDIGNGVLTASYATFVAAPSGCSVAGTTISPGFAIGFHGSFVGVAVTFDAVLTVNPFTFTGSATVEGFSAGPFTLQNASVSVTIGSSFSLTFSGGIQILGPSNQVQVEGSINSSGDINLTGTANVTLSGFSMSMYVHAETIDLSFFGFGHFKYVAVTANASLNVLGSTVSISGYFGPASGGGVEATLQGNASFNPGGYNLGNLNFALTLSPQQQSLTVSGNVDLGGVFQGSISGALSAVNGSVGFNLSVAASFQLGSQVAVSGTLSIGNCSGACTTLTTLGASVSGSFTWAGRTYSFASVSVPPSWSFAVSSSGSVNAQSGVIDTGLIQYSASFVGNYYVSISSSSPYLSVRSGFNAEVQSRGGTLQTHCTGDWRPWTWHCDTYVEWGGWYNLASVGVSIDTAGRFSATYLGSTYQVSI